MRTRYSFLHIHRICLLVFVALVLQACSPSADSTAGVTLTRGVGSFPESMDPQRYRSVQTGNVLRDVREGLLSYSPDGRLIGGVSDSWSVSDDGLEYQFAIRDTARWSNGEPVTADDFVFALRRLFTPSTAAPSASLSSAILHADSIIAGDMPPDRLGVSAKDHRTLVIRLRSPTPYFPQVLTHPSTFPLYRDRAQDQSSPDTIDADIEVVNGAYVVAGSTVSSIVRLERNPHYWDNDNVAYDSVSYVVADPQSELLRFRAGEIDFTESVPNGSFEFVRENYPDELYVGPSFVVYYYGFNLQIPPFKDNPKLREALSLAVDREAIVEAVTRRGELPAYSFVPPSMESYDPYELPFASISKEDRENLARTAYLDAGYSPENPVRFTLWYNTDGGHENIAVALQSMWREVLGAEVELRNTEFKVLVSAVQEGQEVEAFRLSWSGDYLDPDTFLQLFRTSNPNNLTWYSNPEFDRLFDLSSTEVDPAKRSSLLRAAERVALSDHPLMPIYFFVNKHMVSSRVAGYETNLLDIHYSKDLRPAQPSSE